MQGLKILAILWAVILPEIIALGPSPCPSLFQYISEKPREWKGELTLYSAEELQGVWVRLLFDAPVLDVAVDDNFKTNTSNHVEYIVKNREYTLKADTPTKIRITVRHNGDRTPNLVKFRLNARTVCPEHGGEFNWVDNAKSNPSNEYFLGDLNNKDFLNTRPTPTAIGSCGTVPLCPEGFSGSKIVEGQFPWHSTIYLIKGSDKRRICAATLISPSYLLTAAHCVSPKHAEEPLHPDSLLITVGEHYASSKNQGLQEAHAIQVIIHPGYNAINLDNDVAIIKLDKSVAITDYVRPVCLWEESPETGSVLRRQGIVAGLGFDTEGRFSDRLTFGKINIAGRDVCLNNKPELAHFLSEKSLCAGYERGNTICVGESGSGLVFLKQGPKPVWQLRALVALGAGLQNNLVCNESNYIVLTDVAKHLKWIEATII